MTENKVGIGIIGLGEISYGHEAGYFEAQDDCQIVAMCDIDPFLVKDRAAIYAAKAYTDYHELLADPAVDAVDIILPHHLHTKVSLDCLKAKKHVLIEKPMTLKSEEAWSMIEAARENEVILMVAENTRFVKAYQEAKKVINSGALGEILLVKTLIAGSEIGRLKNKALWKGKKDASGGGVIMDCGPHSFYLLKWLFGGVQKVLTHQLTLTEESEVEDYATIHGVLANNSQFITSFSFINSSPWTERLEVIGSKKTLIVDQIQNPVGVVYDGTSDYEGGVLEVDFEPSGWKFFSIVEEIKSFAKIVKEKGIPLVDPVDTWYGLKVIETCYRSAASGQFEPVY